MINFELFLQYVANHKQVKNALEFLGLKHIKDQEKDTLLTIYLIQLGKPKAVHIKVCKTTTC